MTFREGPSVIKVSTLAALFVCNYGVVTWYVYKLIYIHDIIVSNDSFRILPFRENPCQ